MKKILITLIGFCLHLFAQAQICQVSITHIINGNQVQYFGSSPQNPTQWSWFFNGGTPLTSSQQNPIITYNTPGTYICALSVSGGPNNCSAALSNKQDTVTITSTGLNENVSVDEMKIIRQGNQHICIFSSTVSREVELTLVDIRGRVLQQLYEGRLQAGNNQILLQTGQLPSGSYILRAVYEGGQLSRKFVTDSR